MYLDVVMTIVASIEWSLRHACSYTGYIIACVRAGDKIFFVWNKCILQSYKPIKLRKLEHGDFNQSQFSKVSRTFEHSIYSEKSGSEAICERDEVSEVLFFIFLFFWKKTATTFSFFWVSVACLCGSQRGILRGLGASLFRRGSMIRLIEQGDEKSSCGGGGALICRYARV